MSDLLDKLARRAPGICLYGIAPPKLTTAPDRLAELVAIHKERFASLAPDGLIVYDIQDEADRNSAPRPFPFLPTIPPEQYAHELLASVTVPKIVYKSVANTTAASLHDWSRKLSGDDSAGLAVLVGASSARAAGTGLRLEEAYDLMRANAPDVVLGGIAIPERHAVKGDEHERILRKVARGCRFFVTQTVYDATGVKSMLSDYYYALRKTDGVPVPIILTFSPCGSPKTLELMRWLGISIPRWLENELLNDADVLTRSIRLCEELCADVVAFAREKGLPLGVNVESISIRRAEIDASLELFQRLRQLLART